MSYATLSIFLLVASFLAFISHRYQLVSSRFLFLKGIILYGCVAVFCAVFGDYTLLDAARAFEISLDFNDLIIHGLLSYLLYAGSLHLNMSVFFKHVREIAILALVSTSLATVLTACFMFYGSAVIGPTLSWYACLLFAACISPTDPIAVLALLKSLHLPSSLSTKIAGESLLNDGVGIVFFTTFLQLIATPAHGHTVNLPAFFLQQAGGGTLLGVAIAYLAGLLLNNKPLEDKDNAKQDIYWSLCLVNATYLSALYLDVSPALACVAAGLTSASLLSDLQPSRASSLLNFWDIVDDILNTGLFFLTGTYIFALDFNLYSSLLAVLAILVVLGVRIVSVVGPLAFFTRIKHYESIIIAFSGLKGGLSLALALSIPSSFPESDTLVVITFFVVAFTLLLQSAAVSRIARLSSR